MSAREAIIAELENAPESLVLEAYGLILSLKEKAGADVTTARPLPPDFLARQHALFGDLVLKDSQDLLDDLRSDRF